MIQIALQVRQLTGSLKYHNISLILSSTRRSHYQTSISLILKTYYYLRQRRLCFWFSLFVCLFVCLSDDWKSCERILTKFLAGIGHGPWNDGFNFGDNLDYRPDPGVRTPKSEIRIHSIIEKVTNGFWWNFTESWGVAQRPTDYISVTICITIRIRESVPDHDPDPKRTATFLLCWRSVEVCALRAPSSFILYNFIRQHWQQKNKRKLLN